MMNVKDAKKEQEFYKKEEKQEKEHIKPGIFSLPQKKRMHFTPFPFSLLNIFL
jgi:hypothetical protein